jgi:LmbE family N-acetylglucosaminyl deacetylase
MAMIRLGHDSVPAPMICGPLMTAGRLHQRWRALPLGNVSDVIGAGNCLVLAPHPDDESLGCGGLIARCCIESRPPAVVILTDGSGSHPGSRSHPPAKLAALRQQEAVRAVQLLGLPAERLIFLGEADTRAPLAGLAFDRIVARLIACLRTFDCSAILAPWRLDPHCDHAAAARIAAETALIARVRHMSYPVWGWTLPDDSPLDNIAVGGWRLDVTAQLDAKRCAIAAHASQYGQVITDVPDGFQLPVELLRAMDRPWETFILP